MIYRFVTSVILFLVGISCFGPVFSQTEPEPQNCETAAGKINERVIDPWVTVYPSEFEDLLQVCKTEADAGVPYAIYTMGAFYEAGVAGVDKDLSRAMELFYQSADLGVFAAYLNIAHTYRKGAEGFPRDYELAWQFYEKAAAFELPEAYYWFGKMTRSGLGREKDDYRALQYFLEAVELGYDERRAYHDIYNSQLGVLRPALNEFIQTSQRADVCSGVSAGSSYGTDVQQDSESLASLQTEALLCLEANRDRERNELIAFIEDLGITITKNGEAYQADERDPDVRGVVKQFFEQIDAAYDPEITKRRAALEPLGAETIASEIPAFESVPSTQMRDCIIEAAEISDAISGYDELDRDFLVLYASTLSIEELSSKSKGEKTYSDHLSADDLARLSREAKTNRACRELN